MRNLDLATGWLSQKDHRFPAGWMIQPAGLDIRAFCKRLR
jgi:hypothetical protein